MKPYNSVKSRGQSMLEFALVLPLFLMIVFFLIDLGRVVFTYSVMSNAARESARHGVVVFDLVAIEQFARDFSYTLDQSALNVVPYVDNSNPDPGETKIRVTIDYIFTPITPFANLFLEGEGLTLHTQSQMRLER